MFRKEESMAATYVLEQNKDGSFMFTLKAHDGQVLLTSQGYMDKVSALSRINSIRKIAGRDRNFEPRTAENGQPYFVFKNSHNEVIGQSEMYSDSQSVPKGIALVKSNARAARLKDLI
jgi:uncharacterized protein YegP (UPF0339 family)